MRGPKNADAALAEAIYADFTATATKAYEKVLPIPGAEQAMRELAAMKLLATTTGFDRPLCDAILARLGWQHYFTASITSDDVSDGRPAPYMLFRAMESAHVNETAQVMAVGDTPLDLQAANNGGLGAAIGVWSGAATEDRFAQRAQHRRLTQCGRTAGADPPGPAAVALPLSHLRMP